MSTKDSEMQSWGIISKTKNDLSSFPWQIIQYQCNSSLCPNHECQRTWMVLWRPTRPSRTNTQKNVLFIIGDWNPKLGSQEISGVTSKFGLGVQNESGQRITEFCQENTLIIANTLFQQHKRWLYTWTSPDDQYWSDWLYSLQPKTEKLYTVSKKQDRELTVAQIMNSWLQNSDLNWRK